MPTARPPTRRQGHRPAAGRPRGRLGVHHRPAAVSAMSSMSLAMENLRRGSSVGNPTVSPSSAFFNVRSLSSEMLILFMTHSVLFLLSKIVMSTPPFMRWNVTRTSLGSAGMRHSMTTFLESNFFSGCVATGLFDMPRTFSLRLNSSRFAILSAAPSRRKVTPSSWATFSNVGGSCSVRENLFAPSYLRMASSKHLSCFSLALSTDRTPSSN
mmetsp:Transcript_140863/g.450351  ORF Transcript_140863/g.450351 Transcript_140863/m.450351 type:complete len:212 (+) Transcript_140863:55-690(+)